MFYQISILIFSFLVALTTAETEFIAHMCMATGNYTGNSMYKTNLNSAFSSLSSNTTEIDYGFYNVSSGRNPDRVNVIGLCRGDVVSNDCLSCLHESSNNLRELCPNQKEAIIWADECMIRYSNRSIFHNNETSPYLFLYNINNASDSAQFNKVVRTLLDSLQTQAAAGGSMLKYAVGNMSSSTLSEKIYGLVQCTPDLSPAQCSNCLDVAFAVLPRCCDGKIGGRVLQPSCNFRYEIDRFYGLNDRPNAPLPQSAIPPQSSIPLQAAAPPQSNRPAMPPVSSTPQTQNTTPPLPGGGNKNLLFISISTLMAAVPAILLI